MPISEWNSIFSFAWTPFFVTHRLVTPGADLRASPPRPGGGRRGRGAGGDLLDDGGDGLVVAVVAVGDAAAAVAVVDAVVAAVEAVAVALRQGGLLGSDVRGSLVVNLLAGSLEKVYEDIMCVLSACQRYF